MHWIILLCFYKLPSTEFFTEVSVYVSDNRQLPRYFIAHDMDFKREPQRGECFAIRVSQRKFLQI